ncbi:hypothetical protein GCM10010530_09840 [Kribbella aluminosa]
MSLNRTGEELLVRALPPVIHLRATDERAATFRWLLDRSLREASTSAPGARLAADGLAHLLFAERFRSVAGVPGVLAGLHLRQCVQQCVQARRRHGPAPLPLGCSGDPLRRRSGRSGYGVGMP